jgi:hypothetical protein
VTRQLRAFALSLALAIPASLAQAAERPARPTLCPEDAPEGVRLPPRPGCDRSERSAPRRDGVRAPVDGVDIRIGGRVGGEFGVRR